MPLEEPIYLDIHSVDFLVVKVAEAAKVITGIPFPFPFREDEEEQGYAIAESRHDEPEPWLLEDAQAYIWNRLKILGIFKDEASHEILLSDDCPEGEGRRAFCEHYEVNIPPVRFKRIWSILKRGPIEDGCPDDSIDYNKLQATQSTLPEEGDWEFSRHHKPKGQWSDKDLIEAYGPHCHIDIVIELRRRAKGRAIFAFKDEAKLEVDVEATQRFLREARRRETPIHQVMSDCLYQPYKAGEFPKTESLTEEKVADDDND